MNRSLILKVLVVTALAVALTLPVAMIRDLVAERQARRNEAVTGIAEGWGKRQVVTAPYLVFPYERRWIEVQSEQSVDTARETRVERVESNTLILRMAR